MAVDNLQVTVPDITIQTPVVDARELLGGMVDKLKTDMIATPEITADAASTVQISTDFLRTQVESALKNGNQPVLEMIRENGQAAMISGDQQTIDAYRVAAQQALATGDTNTAKFFAAAIGDTGIIMDADKLIATNENKIIEEKIVLSTAEEKLKTEESKNKDKEIKPDSDSLSGTPTTGTTAKVEVKAAEETTKKPDEPSKGETPAQPVVQTDQASGTGTPGDLTASRTTTPDAGEVVKGAGVAAVTGGAMGLGGGRSDAQVFAREQIVKEKVAYDAVLATRTELGIAETPAGDQQVRGAALLSMNIPQELPGGMRVLDAGLNNTQNTAVIDKTVVSAPGDALTLNAPSPSQDAPVPGSSAKPPVELSPQMMELTGMFGGIPGLSDAVGKLSANPSLTDAMSKLTTDYGTNNFSPLVYNSTNPGAAVGDMSPIVVAGAALQNR